MTPEDRKTIEEALEYGIGLARNKQQETGKSHSIVIDQMVRALAILRAEPEAREPKVMTDEEIERIGDEFRSRIKAHDLADGLDEGYIIGVKGGLRYARDNNLLAPLDRSRMIEAVAMIHNDYDASVACSNCGTDGGFSTYDDLDWAKCCPGCGRPISEQVDAKGMRTPHPLYKK